MSMVNCHVLRRHPRTSRRYAAAQNGVRALTLDHLTDNTAARSKFHGHLHDNDIDIANMLRQTAHRLP